MAILTIASLDDVGGPPSILEGGGDLARNAAAAVPEPAGAAMLLASVGVLLGLRRRGGVQWQA